ncbi:hypothetical protein AC244_18400 [Ensifer adhaerens]|uniref:Uncharacterized protein n=1 Tax=Ensifer adhaerens TaxID=106592 RepID=A0A0L8BRP0_ENSAD|nr:hypothetical protein AC244_18400 [Ensifer adhaerens]
MVSLYAEPRKIVDADEVVERLATVIPNLDGRYAQEAAIRLRVPMAETTAQQQADILALGIRPTR